MQAIVNSGNLTPTTASYVSFGMKRRGSPVLVPADGGNVDVGLVNYRKVGKVCEQGNIAQEGVRRHHFKNDEVYPVDPAC